MGLVFDLYQRNHAEKEAVCQEQLKCVYESWRQYQHVQMFYEKELKEIRVERASLASRVSSIEAAHSVRAQEAPAQLHVMSALTEKSFN